MRQQARGDRGEAQAARRGRSLPGMLRFAHPALVVAAVGLGLLGLAGYAGLGPTRAKSLDVFGEAPAFALTDQLERPVRSGDLQRKVIVANFIYTSCRDICPLLSLRMQALQERLRQEQLLSGSVLLLSFTVDPTRDTPAVLRAYAERHQADPNAWRFLTGPEEELLPVVVEGFRIGVEALPPKGIDESTHGGKGEGDGPSEVLHSGRFVLIDREWRIRAYYDGRDLDLDRAVQDIRALLQS